MVKYCPGCGRSIPVDGQLCPYCGKAVPSHGITAMPVEKKSNVGKIILIVAVVIIVLILITVAIAATVYVYVSGMVPQTSSSTENAAVTVSENNDLIQVTLAAGGLNYDSVTGYSSDVFEIYVDSVKITGITDSWLIGGSWNIDSDYSIASDTPTGFEPGRYDVTVKILDGVIFDGSILIFGFGETIDL